MKNVSERLSLILKEKGLTKYKLSKIASVSEATIGRIINNPDQTPNESTILSLASALNISKDWLLSGIGEASARKSVLFNEESDPFLDGLIEKLFNYPAFVRKVDERIDEKNREIIRYLIDDELNDAELINEKRDKKKSKG